MTKSLSDLNDHLYTQMERLMRGELTPEQIETEVTRSASMVQIADRVTGIADMQLKAAKLFADHGQVVLPHLPQIASAKP